MLLFFVGFVMAFCSGCATLFPPAAGHGPVIRLGREVFESPVGSIVGGKGTFSASGDKIILVNTCPEGYTIDFYENGVLRFERISERMVPYVFHPSSPNIDDPVSFLVVVHSPKPSPENPDVVSEHFIRIHSLEGAVTAFWNVDTSGGRPRYERQNNNRF